MLGNARLVRSMVAALVVAPGSLLALAGGPPSVLLISMNSDELSGNDQSLECAVSDDGTLVVFRSRATNLDPRTAEWGTGDRIYLREPTGEGTTTLLSVDADGGEIGGCYNPQISGDGRYVLYQTYTGVGGDENGLSDLYVLDRTKGTLKQASAGLKKAPVDDHVFMDGASFSSNGKYAVAYSNANNLVKEENPGEQQVYFLDVKKRKFTLVSRGTGGTGGNNDSGRPSISPNGKWVAFESSASDLVEGGDSVSRQVYLWSKKGRRITLVSAASGGGPGNDDSNAPAVTDDGSVAYVSNATNLMAQADTDGNAGDLYLWNAAAGITQSLTQGLAIAGDCAGRVSISADGGMVVFDTTQGLLGADTNGLQDVYSWAPASGQLVLLSHALGGGGGNDASQCYAQSLARSGLRMVFATSATDVFAGDGNGSWDVGLSSPSQ